RAPAPEGRRFDGAALAQRACMDKTIGKFMTPMPHSIGANQTMAEAHVMMRNHGVRHLPVLDGGRMVGIVSERDLHLAETLKHIDPKAVRVDEAMTLDPYAVGPHALLRKVAEEMAERKHGSAVVQQGGKVVGIFTTVDALRALASLLRPAQ